MFEPEHLSSNRPIILDETYESPETAALHEEGCEGALVPRADSPTDLISMSAYGKSQPPNPHAFNPGRPYPGSAFSFVPLAYGSQSSVSASVAAPVYHSTTHMNQMNYPSNQVKATYEDQTGPYLNVGSTPIPQVIAYSPSRGSRGTKVSVDITSLYELQTTNTPIFYLLFGRHKSGASLSKVSQQGGVCSYRITAEAPPFSAAGWSSAQVPISLYMETGDGDVIAKVDVGSFNFVDGGHPSLDDPQHEVSRKRKVSDSSELMRSPLKRASSHHVRPKEEFNGYGYASADGNTPYSPYLQSATAYNNLIPQFNRPTPSFHNQASSRQIGYGYSSSVTASPPTIKGDSPQVSNWSPAFPNITSNLARSPGIPSNIVHTRPGMTSLPSPSASANPPLIRTSTLQQTPSPATTPHGQHYNAYALYSQIAKLEIMGDLDSMAQNWSDEECDARRRIVQFRRSQSGSTITTHFHPVSIDERPQHSICISCIYWEEKEECFVTSVDTIYLLEQLVAARFTVEEKNRIRRNLEGFRPLTVSKGKADSEEFFKIIMAFPTPKPRNIEKDVKVFAWKDLSSALKKIISKYSASPSSTLPPVPALLTPVSSTGYTTDSNTASNYINDHPSGAGTGALSPRSLSGSTTSTAYTTSIPARVMSPLNQKPLSNLPQNNNPSDIRVAIPQPHESPAHWQAAQPQHHLATQQYHSPMPSHNHNHNARTSSSWDLSSYLDSNPATAGGGGSSNPASTSATISAPASGSQNYAPRNIADTAGAGGERIVRPLSQQQLHQHQHQQQHQPQSHQMPRA